MQMQKNTTQKPSEKTTLDLFFAQVFCKKGFVVDSFQKDFHGVSELSLRFETLKKTPPKNEVGRYSKIMTPKQCHSPLAFFSSAPLFLPIRTPFPSCLRLCVAVANGALVVGPWSVANPESSLRSTRAKSSPGCVLSHWGLTG
jgi:hypothetical protein